MRILTILILVLGLPLSVSAQTTDRQKLADIRAEIGELSAQIQRLKLELQTETPATTGIADATPILQRIELMEQELRRVTDQVERLQFDIRQIVADGTNRIDDLKFRLTELEGGDIASIPETTPLGTGSTTPTSRPASDNNGTPTTIRPVLRPRDQAQTPVIETTPPIETPAGDVLAQVPQTEQEMFDAGLAAFRSGAYRDASDRFAELLVKHPNGPMASDAAFWQGEALANQGEWNLAARSYLNSFSGAPQGAKAPEALFRLGVSLGRLGQTDEACLTLAEVGNRYPNVSPAILDSTNQERQALGCS
ncbi:tol-pal system protein YbgF [Halovulum sp. GXIMD14793]